MSSGTPVNIGAAGALAKGLAKPNSPDVVHNDGVPTMGLSKRQMELDYLWRFYRCSCYDHRRVDWDGKERVGKIEHEVISAQGAIPAGYWDAGATLPLKYRKPTAPFYLARVVVDRFTSLLFSNRRMPKIKCDDEKTEDWLNGFVKVTRLWQRFLLARAMGGAMGSVCAGFKIIDGKPFVEIHDPRWCTPTFSDKAELVVSSLEKRYQFPEEIRDPETGEWKEVWFWYRRVITTVDDQVWARVPVEANIEPRWNHIPHETVMHNYGFCPVVWIQNKPVEDDIDGDSDCHGIYDIIEAIDALAAQANRGTIANCDPSTHLASDAEFHEVKKGSGTTLQTEKGGMFSYVEMTGAGPKMAMELSEKFEERALIVVRCFLDTNIGGPSRTVEEVERNYSSMIEQADVLREQYGERGVKRLLEMVLQAVRAQGTTRIVKDGENPRIVRGVVKLPRRKEVSEDGRVTFYERELGTSEMVDLAWPDYFTPSSDSISKAVTAAATAQRDHLVDDEHAIRFVAPLFNVEDVRAMIEKIRKQREEAQERFEAGVLADVSGRQGPPQKPSPSAGKAEDLNRAGEEDDDEEDDEDA